LLENNKKKIYTRTETAKKNYFSTNDNESKNNKKKYEREKK